MKIHGNGTVYLVLPIFFSLAVTGIKPYLSNVYEWLAYDYLTRAIVMSYILLLTDVRAYVFAEYGKPWLLDTRFPSRKEKFLGAVFVLLILDQLLIIPLNIINNAYIETVLFRYFEITDQPLLIFDLSVGLLLVAFSEEILFRGFMKSLLEKVWGNTLFIIVVSGIIFGLAHWPSGLGRVVYAGLGGMVMMAIYLSSKSLWPTTIAHYLINFWGFWPD